MADQYPYQPQVLVGNPFSAAYFGALKQRAGPARCACAYCGLDLTNKSRAADGSGMVWCDYGHRDLWARAKTMNELRLELTRRGWTPEKWAARPRDE